MTTKEGRLISCSDCGKETTRHSRGVCMRCYYHYRRNGTRELIPRTTRPHVETIENLTFLLDNGSTYDEAFSRLDTSHNTLYKVCTRTGRLDLWERLAARRTP